MQKDGHLLLRCQSAVCCDVDEERFPARELAPRELRAVFGGDDVVCGGQILVNVEEDRGWITCKPNPVAKV